MQLKTRMVMVGSLVAVGSVSYAGRGGLNDEEILMPGQSISNGTMSGCEFALTMMPDGNLELRDDRGLSGWDTADTYWSSNSPGGGYARRRSDGNLQILDWSDNVVWDNGVHNNYNGGLGLLSDGNLVEFNASFQVANAVWSTNTTRSYTVAPGTCTGLDRSTIQLRLGIDLAGGDFFHYAMSVPRASWCAYSCQQNASCSAFTYVPPGIQGPSAQCWLKNPHYKYPGNKDIRMTSGWITHG